VPHWLLQNIFMSDGRAILGDFGYGMQYDNDMPSSTSVGSLHYASPEVILKESTYIGPEIDVWSLGTTFYRLAVRLMMGTFTNLSFSFISVQAVCSTRWSAATPRSRARP